MTRLLRSIVCGVSVALTENERRSLRHAVGVLGVFIGQTRCDWQHPAVDRAWCEDAVERLRALAESGRPANGDHLLLYRTAAIILVAESTGPLHLIRDLLGLALRVAPLEPVSEIGRRSRPSPLALA